MKLLLNTLIGIIIISIVSSSCQKRSDAMQDDLMASMKPGKVEEVINVNEEISMMAIKDHHAMMKIMKDHPEIMEGVLKDMIEACKSDSSMMSSICKTVVADKQLMDRIRTIKNTDVHQFTSLNN